MEDCKHVEAHHARLLERMSCNGGHSVCSHLLPLLPLPTSMHGTWHHYQWQNHSSLVVRTVHLLRFAIYGICEKPMTKFWVPFWHLITSPILQKSWVRSCRKRANFLNFARFRCSPC